VGFWGSFRLTPSSLQYAESKLGLEALCHKWHSESWGDYVSITGAVIGWTRGTGLMAENNGEYEFSVLHEYLANQLAAAT
jgi:hypothetical protein